MADLSLMVIGIPSVVLAPCPNSVLTVLKVTDKLYHVHITIFVLLAKSRVALLICNVDNPVCLVTLTNNTSSYRQPEFPLSEIMHTTQVQMEVNYNFYFGGAFMSFINTSLLAEICVMLFLTGSKTLA